MRFLGGLLKFLGIVLLLGATVACTFIAVDADVTEAYIVMALVWVGIVLLDLVFIGAGIALTQIAKLKKRVYKLEQDAIYRVMPRMAVEETASKIAPQYMPPVTEKKAPAPAPKKRSKAWIVIVVVLAVLLALAGVAALIVPNLISDKEISISGESIIRTEATEAAEVQVEDVRCAMTINGICVDDSYQDKDGKPLKLLYLFYTITADDTNLEIDSKYTNMYIGNNSYSSDHYADVASACKYTRNYYYGSYIKDVYVGESMNVVATFYIPEGELTESKTVTLEDHQIPGIHAVSFDTSDVVYYADGEEIAMAMDPEGYEVSMYEREEADAATTKQVQKLLNGKYWSFYVNNLAYKLSFTSPNKFTVTTAYSNSSGTYSVRNGYIFCTYPNNGYTVEIPYEIVDGKMDLDTIAGFDVMSN